MELCEHAYHQNFSTFPSSILSLPSHFSYLPTSYLFFTTWPTTSSFSIRKWPLVMPLSKSEIWPYGWTLTTWMIKHMDQTWKEGCNWWNGFQDLDETNRWRERMNARKWMEGMNSPHDEVDSMQMKQQCRWNLWDNWIDSFGLFDDINGIGWTWMKLKLMDELFLQYEVVITIMIEKFVPVFLPFQCSSLSPSPSTLPPQNPKPTPFLLMQKKNQH